VDSDIDWSNSVTTITGSWTAFEDSSGIKFYTVSIGTSPGSDDAYEWDNKDGRQIVYEFTALNLQDNETYYINVKATDLLGNVSQVASSDGFTVDQTQPTVSSITVAPNSTVPIFEDIVIDYVLSEPVLDVSVEFVSQLTDTPQFNYVLVDSKKVTITLKAPFVSGDEFTFTVSNMVDRAGNIALTNQYIYTVGYLADYDLDGSIGVSDFNSFISGWFDKDTAYEIGPVNGTAPYLRPNLDGVYNSQDGMAFYYMWHWDNSQAGKLVTKALPKIGEDVTIAYDNEGLKISPPKDVHGAEVIINYPINDIKILPSDQSSGPALGTSLSKVDTLSGHILTHVLTEGADIGFNLDFNSRKDITIQISYTFIGKDNQVIVSGYTDYVLVPIPTEFTLQQNYPNPFNPSTTINYDLPKDAFVNIIIYDMLGREVRSLINENKSAGYHSQIWNSKDGQGRAVAAGIYFYQIRSEGFLKTRKMVLLK